MHASGDVGHLNLSQKQYPKSHVDEVPLFAPGMVDGWTKLIIWVAGIDYAFGL